MANKWNFERVSGYEPGTRTSDPTLEQGSVRMSNTDFEAQVHLADLRQRVLNNVEAQRRGEPYEEITPDEYRLLLLDLRRGRDMAAAASKSAKAKEARERKAASKPIMDLQEIFKQTIQDRDEL